MHECSFLTLQEGDVGVVEAQHAAYHFLCCSFGKTCICLPPRQIDLHHSATAGYQCKASTRIDSVTLTYDSRSIHALVTSLTLQEGAVEVEEAQHAAPAQHIRIDFLNGKMPRSETLHMSGHPYSPGPTIMTPFVTRWGHAPPPTPDADPARHVELTQG
jgi:hypothetical protein